MIVAFDTETALIRPALLAPPLVCLTWQSPGEEAQIAHVSDAEPILRQWLESDVILVGHNVAYDLAVIAQRFPHLDSLIIKACDEDRVTDTMIRQWLLDGAGGVYRGRTDDKGKYFAYEYTLEALARRNTDLRLFKDGWRLSYAEFIDTPLPEWPRRAREVQEAARPRVAELNAWIADCTDAFGDEAREKALIRERDGLEEMIASDPSRASEYPLDDARATLAVWQAQEAHAHYLKDQHRQTRAYVALYRSSAWGLRTDEEGVEQLARVTKAAADELEDDLIQIGLLRANKTRDTKAARARMVRVCREGGLTLRRTDGHFAVIPAGEPSKCKSADGVLLEPGDDACVEHVSLDADACNASEDEVLIHYAEISTLKKVLANDVKALQKGTIYPVHTRYGYAETGRTTSSKPPIQNLCKREGIREAFVARPGTVFAAADFPSVELFTHAQCCATWLGQSKLAEALNGGMDPHVAMAAQMMGIAYVDAYARYRAGDRDVADMRQLAKIANFGFPGGMGAKKLAASARKQLAGNPELVARLDLSVDRMKKLKTQWFETWPEMPHYFAHINALCDTYDGRATVETLFTERIRGGATYCAACNNGFQALAADCAKEALWRVCREQYDEPTSALYNTRTVAFVHDEIIIEAPEATAHEAAQRLADVMVAGANLYLPDVPIQRSKLEPLLMRRWSKKAKPVTGADGRLVPWEEM